MVGSVAISEMSWMILSSDLPAGNSLLPGFPVPGLWPPPVASPSRVCLRRADEVKSTNSPAPFAALT